MPELPEVETVCRGLALKLEGRRLVRVEQNRPDLRIPLPADFVARLTGRRIERIRRRAKYILMDLDGPDILIAHLGMSGRMVLGRVPEGPAGPHDHVRFVADDGAVVTYNDHRRFGLMTLAPADRIDEHPLLAGLGPEPLGNEFSAATLSAAVAGKRTPIKAALLDQAVVAGLGNIYVCEALYRAGISPRRSAHTVAGARAERLVPAIRAVLTEAIAAGGSSLRDYVQADGELGYFQNAWAVYGREGEPCPGCTCGATVKRIVQSNRSTFYCAHRQR
jgi:formamidopyrimidine-DNA glycosylase